MFRKNYSAIFTAITLESDLGFFFKLRKDVQRWTECVGKLPETEHDLHVWKCELNSRIRESRTAPKQRHENPNK